MAKQLPALSAHLQAFVEAQRIFFAGTAAPEGRVNLSPKGMDSLRVLTPTRVAWLNVTGSGNETAAHLQRSPRMTLMFCAFEGPPLILRLYGQAHMIQPADPEWPGLLSLFPDLPGARQIYVLDIDLVQTSCGMAVPTFSYQAERDELNALHRRMGPEEIRSYWLRRNTHSIDGFPTGIQTTVDT
ncbi:pyridoxamine 5'-phosphate oxidase family protein [Deinococcus aquaedulcis]|uniref:pyridoxamine 5'-phosphate oxidase family protein n=1 Tax=Deinococcus aquaedulcis TaxID=2840455 RepID=UPI001C840124|nr:pyridoxamine 5'-phosphate oxidase family protein [Deinococcus aquaedulcis]